MPSLSPSSIQITLDTPVVLPAGWVGHVEGGAVRRLPLRAVFARTERSDDVRGGARAPRLIDLARLLIEVPASEVLADDSPTTAAVNAVTRQLMTLRRVWQRQP